MELSEAAKEARRIYKRQWVQANPEKVREHQKRYWEKVAREAAAREGRKDDSRIPSDGSE